MRTAGNGRFGVLELSRKTRSPCRHRAGPVIFVTLCAVRGRWSLRFSRLDTPQTVGRCPRPQNLRKLCADGRNPTCQSMCSPAHEKWGYRAPAGGRPVAKVCAAAASEVIPTNQWQQRHGVLVGPVRPPAASPEANRASSASCASWPAAPGILHSENDPCNKLDFSGVAGKEIVVLSEC
jgi:hypothetical protein